MTTPNSKNFCGGNFQDWLEVNLLEQCNAKCSWCIERNGYHPDFHASVEVIAEEAIKTGKTNIILLGGEPLLYKELKKLIQLLVKANRKVWITTNGFLLSPKFVFENLQGITGVNISIHDFDMSRNKEITKILIDENNLILAIASMQLFEINVRMNCNVIKNHIDSASKIVEYVRWVKTIGANKIRFAELKNEEGDFVDLAEILNHKYGLNDNPFLEGCNSDCVIEDIPVNFRQMCGLQTSRRVKPEDPEQETKEVLYYDGKIYNGWQTIKKENDMETNKLEKIVKSLTGGKLSDDEVENLVALFSEVIKTEVAKTPKEIVTRVVHESSGGCCY
jgi:organic radical activating enzyme